MNVSAKLPFSLVVDLAAYHNTGKARARMAKVQDSVNFGQHKRASTS